MLNNTQKFQSKDSHFDMNFCYDFLFNKYKYKLFNSVKARCSSFSINKRPKSNDWNNYFKIWLSMKLICEVYSSNETNLYRFNIKTNGKILTFDNLYKNIKKFSFKKMNSLNNLKMKINSNYRPDTLTLVDFFNDLEADGTFKNLKIFYDKSTLNFYSE